ncbi:ParB/RepB/Spo0J family partition protein [Streptomyces sp. CC228A]|uniref:ParB/RepB/Spo0J family partition protein n=1 Tax=Streptomyces sp. CC228A TaxID=2898186 RepID=UPI001F1AB129|nr:ParB/RepB/Spo0J family partition protein [Streptomyces sp. CC228A]
MAGKRINLSTLAAQPVEESPGHGKPVLVHLPPRQIAPTPLNPRRDFAESSLRELGESMRAGQLQPCVGVSRAAYLRLFPEHADVIPECRIVMAAGQRRWEAARLVDLPSLDVHVRDDIAESRVRFLSAVLDENLDRRNFNFIEEARGLRQMLELSDGNQAKAAAQLRKSPQWLSQRIGILRLTPEMQKLVTSGKLTAFREMRRYAAMPPEEQMPAWLADQEAAKAARSEPAHEGEAAEMYTAVYAKGADRQLADVGAPDGGGTGAGIPDASGPGTSAPTAAGPAPQADVSLPAQAPAGTTAQSQARSKSSAPPQVKMPWHNGVECAELALMKMSRDQRVALVEHLVRRMLQAGELQPTAVQAALEL